MAIKTKNKLVVLGTGGTIAGLAASASDDVGYTAAQVGIAQLIAAIPALALARLELVVEQVAQINSKDMGFEIWQRLAQRCLYFLAQPEVQGIVVTHGTDTIEETAYFLHAALSGAGVAAKPVVLTGAMRPASSLTPDGPQNLRDALTVAADPGVSGVLVVFAGTLHSAVDVQKVHTHRLNAFDSGDAGPLGYVQTGAVRMVRNWSWGASTPQPGAPWVGHDRAGQRGLERSSPTARWPRVEIIMNYAGAGGLIVDSLLSHAVGSADAVQGIVVAATGNGTLHQDLEAALLRAQAGGVQVVRATRCTAGRALTGAEDAIPDSDGLSPVKARIALMLKLMRGPGAAQPATSSGSGGS